MLIRNIRHDQSLLGKGLGGTTVQYFFMSGKSFKKNKKEKKSFIFFFDCWYNFEYGENAMENANVLRIQELEYR